MTGPKICRNYLASPAEPRERCKEQCVLSQCRQTDDGIKLFLGGLSWSLSEGDVTI